MTNKELDLLEIILDSGPVVMGVLILLIICSIVSWAIIFYKRSMFKKVMKADKDFYETFNRTHSLDHINSNIQSHQSSTLAVMFQKAYFEYVNLKSELSAKENSDKGSFQNYLKSFGTTALERSLKVGANDAQGLLQSKLSTLASIGSITPFIGLFGTVWGIINSFKGIAQGGGQIEAIAPGIAEALVATAVGLFAAIPAVWLYNIFITKVGDIQSVMDSFAQDFLNKVERESLRES